jgi:hypothetical protein
MTTPDKDGWIKHDGGRSPLAPYTIAECEYDSHTTMGYAFEARWDHVVQYRALVPDHTVTPGPSPFVAETAARIMAGMAASGDDWSTIEVMAAMAVKHAQALEAALKEAGE